MKKDGKIKKGGGAAGAGAAGGDNDKHKSDPVIDEDDDQATMEATMEVARLLEQEYARSDEAGDKVLRETLAALSGMKRGLDDSDAAGYGEGGQGHEHEHEQHNYDSVD